ncbi:MAG: 4-vinyl reductase [Pseudanabaena frigida]|uniref:4-vinyl reductase n=1 Tax=Pseudanabaena frigida TaxID=945775 RepID=A0A2W4VTK1_9CYAN|nr:MAG: 4-vinyl reductase [Pseudanabaena frigida]
MPNSTFRSDEEDLFPLTPLSQVCHYSRHTFFKFDRSKGQIADWNQHKYVLASDDFIVSLLKGLEHEVGEASGWLMYLIGKDWGTEDAKSFKTWFERDYHLSINKSSLIFALETWWWPLTAQGWGKWNVDLSSIREGFIFIDLFDSAVAKSMGNIGKPVCFLYAGLLAGFFSVMLNRGLSSTEIQCYSMGNNFCRFLIGSETRIKAAEFWLSSGATAQEIETRLLNQEDTESSGSSQLMETGGL